MPVRTKPGFTVTTRRPRVPVAQVEAVQIVRQARLRRAVQGDRLARAISRDRREDAERSATDAQVRSRALAEQDRLGEVDVEQPRTQLRVGLELVLRRERAGGEHHEIDPSELALGGVERGRDGLGRRQVAAHAEHAPAGAARLEIRGAARELRLVAAEQADPLPARRERGARARGRSLACRRARPRSRGGTEKLRAPEPREQAEVRSNRRERSHLRLTEEP